MTCNDDVDDSLVWMQFGKTKYGVIHGIVYLYIAKSIWFLPSNTDQNVDQGASCLLLLLLLFWTDDQRKKGNYWENLKPSATEPLLILLSSFDSSVTSPPPQDKHWLVFLAGGFAGIFSWITTYPQVWTILMNMCIQIAKRQNTESGVQKIIIQAPLLQNHYRFNLYKCASHGL